MRQWCLWLQNSTVGERRGRSQTVLIAAELPVTDRAFLGARGNELCRDVPVFSAYRLDDKHQRHNSTLSVRLSLFPMIFIDQL